MVSRLRAPRGRGVRRAAAGRAARALRSLKPVHRACGDQSAEVWGQKQTSQWHLKSSVFLHETVASGPERADS